MGPLQMPGGGRGALLGGLQASTLSQRLVSRGCTLSSGCGDALVQVRLPAKKPAQLSDAVIAAAQEQRVARVGCRIKVKAIADKGGFAASVVRIHAAGAPTQWGTALAQSVALLRRGYERLGEAYRLTVDQQARDGRGHIT